MGREEKRRDCELLNQIRSSLAIAHGSIVLHPPRAAVYCISPLFLHLAPWSAHLAGGAGTQPGLACSTRRTRTLSMKKLNALDDDRRCRQRQESRRKRDFSNWLSFRQRLQLTVGASNVICYHPLVQSQDLKMSLVALLLVLFRDSIEIFVGPCFFWHSYLLPQKRKTS